MFGRKISSLSGNYRKIPANFPLPVQFNQVQMLEIFSSHGPALNLRSVRTSGRIKNRTDHSRQTLTYILWPRLRLRTGESVKPTKNYTKRLLSRVAFGCSKLT